MQTKLEYAKTCVRDKRFEEAKQVISSIIQSQQYAHNDRLYCKLGDVCIELEQYSEAQNYYQQAMQENASNATAFFKDGYLLHQYFDESHRFQAQLRYQQCLKLAPNHEQCMFHYGVLLQSQHDFVSAKRMFVRCLVINDKRACINYHLAKILIHENKKDDQIAIEHLLQKCIQYQPQPTAKYHFEYAQYLDRHNKLNLAKQHYLTALKCIDFGDADMLYKYHQFLWRGTNQKQEALHYLAMAACIDKQYESEHNKRSKSIVIDSIEEQTEGKVSSHKDPKRIKLIIYEFECVITYWNLSKTINADIHELYDMRTKDLVRIFGGYDRIDRLKQHFEFILCHHETRLVIISLTTTDIVREALKRTDLLQYFALIIGPDTSSFLSKTKNKLTDIIKLKHQNMLFDANGVLYIDSNPEHIDQVQTQCRTYHVDPSVSEPFLSMTPDNLHEIECMIAGQQYSPQFETFASLHEINSRLLDDIIFQIGRTRENSPIEELPCIQYIERRLREKQTAYREFKNFAIVFHQAFTAMEHQEWWTAGFIVQNLLKSVPNSFDLWRKYAKCVSYLRHIQAAELAYCKALKLRPNNFWTTVSYAYHLFFADNYTKAEQIFATALKLADGVTKKSTVYLGLARTLEYLDQPEKTHRFYQLALADKADAGLLGDTKKQRFYQNAHFLYASFLCGSERFDEAREHMEICLRIKCRHSQHRPVNYHRKYAQILYNLGEYEKCQHHLEIAYDMDPYCPVTKDYMRRYMRPLTEQNGHQYLKDNSCVASKGDIDWKSTTSQDIRWEYEGEMKPNQT